MWRNEKQMRCNNKNATPLEEEREKKLLIYISVSKLFYLKTKSTYGHFM
jgi:hypothetical protein